MEEVENWVNSVVAKLDDSLKNFDEVINVESRLSKFKVHYNYVAYSCDWQTQTSCVKDTKEWWHL